MLHLSTFYFSDVHLFFFYSFFGLQGWFTLRVAAHSYAHMPDLFFRVTTRLTPPIKKLALTIRALIIATPGGFLLVCEQLIVCIVCVPQTLYTEI